MKDINDLTIHYMSDLHLEFGGLTGMPNLGGDVLLLAGDICVADYLRPERTDKVARRHQFTVQHFFQTVSDKYDQVYMILGNHEYYHGWFWETPDIMRTLLDQWHNVHLLEDCSVPLASGVRLWGGTMWTDFNNENPVDMSVAQRTMNDFALIKYTVEAYRTVRLTPGNTATSHRAAVSALQRDIQEHTDDQFVVMTHHAPTNLSVAPIYHDSPYNAAYHGSLGNLIADNEQIRFWIHGHMHNNSDYQIGKCNVLCNPRGYHGKDINSGFQCPATLPDFDQNLLDLDNQDR